MGTYQIESFGNHADRGAFRVNLLIYMRQENGNPADIYRQLDYRCIVNDVLTCHEHAHTNSGNKVWLQGIVSELSTPENSIFFLDETMSWDEINSTYDAIVFSTANLFCPDNLEIVRYLTSEFRQSKIPIYVLSVGAQAESYDDIDILVYAIRKDVRDFVNAVYKSGGEFGVRGYFTKEVLDRICDNSSVVTGCPSLFQSGRELNISNEKVRRSGFNIALNGPLSLFLANRHRYNSVTFIDQHDYFEYLYDNRYYSGEDKTIIRSLIRGLGLDITQILLSGDVRLFYDTTEWKNFFRDKNVSFSIGTRIHGNIMALLSNVPALLLSSDARTREMSEYYNIPYMDVSFDDYNNLNCYELYEQLDYTHFNREFPHLFDAFENFLIDHGLVSHINTDNQFWRKPEPIHNDELISLQKELLDYINKHYSLFQLYEILLKVKRRLQFIVGE